MSPLDRFVELLQAVPWPVALVCAVIVRAIQIGLLVALLVVTYRGA